MLYGDDVSPWLFRLPPQQQDNDGWAEKTGWKQKMARNKFETEPGT